MEEMLHTDTTKRLLTESLKRLMAQKPLNKISIREITEGCGVNRQTFYYHFQDIVDLVEWICITDGDAVLKDNRTYETWQKGYLSIFRAMQQDKAFIMNIYRHAPRESLYNYLYRLTYKLMLDVANELCETESLNVREEDRSFVANFFKFGFVGLVLEWIEHGMQEEPEQIVSHVENLIRGTMELALKNAAWK